MDLDAVAAVDLEAAVVLATMVRHIAVDLVQDAVVDLRHVAYLAVAGDLPDLAVQALAPLEDLLQDSATALLLAHFVALLDHLALHNQAVALLLATVVVHFQVGVLPDQVDPAALLATALPGPAALLRDGAVQDLVAPWALAGQVCSAHLARVVRWVRHWAWARVARWVPAVLSDHQERRLAPAHLRRNRCSQWCHPCSSSSSSRSNKQPDLRPMPWCVLWL